MVKDPVGLSYHRFQEEECAILKMLDGRSSLDQIKRRFEQKFPPQRISTSELTQFIGMLHGNCLVISEASGQGGQQFARHQERTRRERLAAMTNVLCIRFRGVDPDRLLTWLDGKVGWVFSLAASFGCLALATASLLLVSVQFHVFQSKLPAFYEFFAARNWIWLALTLAVIKVLHELGHGLACKHFGGECHETGVMVLVLTPCLYCNVSDAWLLPNKWHRALIGAAGMYVEAVIASVCTFLWWFSQPGMLNSLCLNAMFVCSVSTIVFNGNPLLRYDGYYILSDVVEIPNLRQNASAILRRKLGAWLLGLSEPFDPFLPKRNQMFLALYTVAASVYRWVVVLSILWFLYHIFEPYGLKVVGQLIAGMSVFGLIVQPVWQLARFFYIPGRIDQVKMSRMLTSLAVVGALLLAAVLVPLPRFVRCSVQIQPGGASSIYVDVPGTLLAIHVRPGQRVKKGQPLVDLENLDLEIAVAQLNGQHEQLVAQLEDLRQRQFTDQGAGLEIAQVLQSRNAVAEQLAKRRRDLARLKMVAPADGTVLPPPSVPAAAVRGGRLGAWSGTPLEEKNLGAYLADGLLLCQIGGQRALEAVVAIDQSDIELVRQGQRIEIQLEQLPGETFQSQIQEVSYLDLKYTPPSLSSKAGGDLATRTDDAGRERPLNTTYQASAPLDDQRGVVYLRTRGHAKIHVGAQTIAGRLWRYLSQTFHFRL